MPQCLISLGANIGDPLAAIQKAADSLREQLGCVRDDFRLSRFYHTPPVGGPAGQPPFVNAVVAVSTSLSPWEVWEAVRNVEQQLGRQRLKRWEARRIDLDILLYDDVRVWTPQLKIPHPRMCMRRFILEPAFDVAKDWVDPVSLQSIRQLTERLRGSRGNLLLCGAASSRSLLEEVARSAVAQWRDIQNVVDDIVDAGLAQSRWVAWQSIDAFEDAAAGGPLEPPPKLTIFLTEAHESSGAQWEDVHRGLAERLRLVSARATQRSLAQAASRPSHVAWGATGARYLLATDDREWAVHEMISALEAMDCPVEPISPVDLQSGIE